MRNVHAIIFVQKLALALGLSAVVSVPAAGHLLSAQEKLANKHEEERNEDFVDSLGELAQDTREVKSIATKEARVTDSQLYDLLQEYSTRFPGLVAFGGNMMMGKTEASYEYKRNFITWKYSMVSAVNNIIIQPNPRVALVDLVTFTSRSAEFAKGKKGKAFLGPFQPEVSEAISTADEWSWWLADVVLDEADYDKLRETVMAWCAKNPMDSFYGPDRMGSLAGDRYSPPPSETLSGGLFFGGMEEGINSTVNQMQQANRNLQNFYNLIDWMPVYAYWMTEIAAFNFLNSPEGKSLIDFAHKVGENQMKLGQLVDYFSQINRIVQPLLDKMEEPEYQDWPVQALDSIERINELSERMITLEQTLTNLINDVEGKPLTERWASIDENIAKLSTLTEELRPGVLALQEMGDYKKEVSLLIEQLKWMAVFVGLSLFVCLLAYRFFSHWLERKVFAKSELPHKES